MEVFEVVVGAVSEVVEAFVEVGVGLFVVEVEDVAGSGAVGLSEDVASGGDGGDGGEGD